MDSRINQVVINGKTGQIEELNDFNGMLAVNFTPMAGLILIFLYCCRLLIDGILNVSKLIDNTCGTSPVYFPQRDSEKLLLWLIGSALFNAFLVLDFLRGDLIFGNLAAAVLILIWTSVLVVYLEFLKDGKSLIQKQLHTTGFNAKAECGDEAIEVQ